MKCGHYLAALVALIPMLASAGITLPAMISDNMVLQRSGATRVWGKADPGEAVTVAVAGAQANTLADKDGKWLVKLDLAAASAGPYEMTVEGKDRRSVANVLIGEVWLAGGQSNMEMPFKNWGGVFGREELFRKALGKPIRVFRVPHGSNIGNRLEDCKGKWEIPSPDNMPEFAAVPFSCAYELNRVLNVPVGCVDNSNGGTTALNWTSREAAMMNAEDAKLIETQEHNERLQNAFRVWCSRNRCQAKSLYLEEHFTPFVTQQVGWSEATLPAAMDHGVTWFRRRISLPDKMRQNRFQLTGTSTKNLTFQFYYNGVKNFSGIFGARDLRTVPLDIGFDGKTFPEGEFMLFLRVISPTMEGEILPGKLRFDLWNGHETVDLTGKWEKLTEVAFPALNPEYGVPEPFDVITGHTAFYNIMLYPVRKATFRGILWYQGCNDASEWQAYERRLKAMIGCWRDTLQSPDIPFYICQLHGFGGTPAKPGQDYDKAHIREIHEKVAREVPNSGMIVTTDFGESECHSRHKIGLGFRLANLLLAKTYGKPVDYAGPLFKSGLRDGSAVVLAFDPVGKGLKAAEIIKAHTTCAGGDMRTYTRLSPADSQLEGFEIQDADGTWCWAYARIEGQTVVVSHPDVKQPKCVRYNWGDLVFGNLYGLSDIPAGPFRCEVTAR